MRIVYVAKCICSDLKWYLLKMLTWVCEFLWWWFKLDCYVHQCGRRTWRKKIVL